jgi:predicted dehydrogenase
MPPRLKLGLVGAGPVATRFCVPAIRAVPEVVAYMIADLDDERARAVADTCPFVNRTQDFTDLCDQVDLAIVALPNHLHQPVSCRLLEAGVHVLCVKPMARNVEECQRMMASAETGGAILAVGHHRRFRSNMQQGKELLDNGLIGRVRRVEAQEGSISDWPRSPAYFDPAQAGGGALLDLGVHCIDLIRWLVGEFVDLQYSGNQTPARVESEADLRFQLEDGVEGRLLMSRDRDLRNHIRLFGTEGSLTLGLWEPDIILERPQGKAFRHFPSLQLSPIRRAMDASYVNMLSHFITAIHSHTQPEVDGMEGLRAVEVVQWAYQGTRPAAAAVASGCH